MILGIDASNIRGGGGITYLSGLLAAADPIAHGFSQIVVWSGQATLNHIEDRPWLVKNHQPMLDKSLAHRTFWQRFNLSESARRFHCDLLFVPGGSFAGDFHPMATISRNLLPFEWRELRRYGRSRRTLKFLALRWSQSRSFRRADGLIFLTRYARDTVMNVIKKSANRTTVIPHGVHDGFASRPREQLEIGKYTKGSPFRILYVSTVDMYKHQWSAVEAVGQLRADGMPVTLELIGPAYPPALDRLRQTMNTIDPEGEFIFYSGAVPHKELSGRFEGADMFLFASSCENMPNILLEGMASGLPIACSDRGPMPEVLGDAGGYFDPERSQDMARALRELIASPQLRARKARAAFERVKAYSWVRCANETFSFLADVALAGGNTKRGKAPAQG